MERAAMNDDSLGTNFACDLQNTLVARVHELGQCGTPFSETSCVERHYAWSRQ